MSNRQWPIEQLNLGQRVLTEVAASGAGAPPPILGDPSATSIDPATWRAVSLRMANPDVPGTSYEMELLEPLEWIAANGAAAGRNVYLSLPELGVSGLAEVLGISECPPIESGYGRLVLGTFTSVSKDVYELKLAGSEETIGVTFGQRVALA